MEAVVGGELAKMYALRAGISQIAIDNDQVNSIEKQTKADCKPTLKKVRETKASINKKNKTIEQIQNDIEKHKRIEGKMVQVRALKKKVNGIRFAVLVGIVLLFAVVYALFFLGKKVDTWKLILFIAGAFALFCVVAKIVVHFTGEYYYKTYGEKIDKEFETRNYEQTKWKKSDYQKSDAEIARLKADVAQEEKQLPLYNSQIEQIEEKAKKLSTPCYVRADAVHKSLVEEFAPFIDERDWENLDLIIYAFETGRADNLKEALKFIDEERRANQILTAVNNATQQICHTINTGFSHMAQAMTLCFQRLSVQIQANANKQQELMGAMGEKLSSVVEGIDYNNALLKKQNESTEKMMRDIKPFLYNANQLLARELGNAYTSPGLVRSLNLS